MAELFIFKKIFQFFLWFLKPMNFKIFPLKNPPKTQNRILCGPVRKPGSLCVLCVFKEERRLRKPCY